MAGLLDYGNADTGMSPQDMGLLALAAGLMQGNPGGGVLGYANTLQSAQENALKRQYMGAQMENLSSEIRTRDAALKKQSDLMDFIRGRANGSDAPSQPVSAAPGQLGSGSFGIVSPPAGMPSIPQGSSQGQSGGAQQRQDWLQSLTPSEMLYMKASGLDPTDIYNTFKPKFENVGGNLVNTNAPGFKGGFQPQYTVDQQGHAILSTPDGNGGMRVSIPENALNAVSQYTNATERSKNRNTPLPLGYLARGTNLPIGGSIDSYLNPDSQPSPSQGQQGPQIQNQGPGSLSPQLQAALMADSRAQGFNTPPTAKFIAPPGMQNPVFGFQPTSASAPAAIGAANPFSPRITPPTGGLAGPAEIAAATTAGTKAAESGQAYKDALDGKVEEEFQLVNRNKQITPLLDKFSTGGIAPETRLQLGNAIANTGMLPDALKQPLSTWVANGDPATGKVIQNQLASAGILTMLQTLDKEGKPNRAIFQAVQKAQEGLESGNTTLKDVFELQKRLYDIHYNEQQALTKSIKDGNYDPRTWAGDYSAIRNANLNMPAEPLPSATPPAPAASASSGSPGTKAIIRTGTLNGRKVIQYSDGTTSYAN